MSKDWQSQAHVKWECKYHVVILPKYRKKELFGRTRKAIGKILRELCRQKEVELVEGKAMPDHIHMLLSVPPKYSIAMTMGYLKGKSAIRIHREVLRTKGTLFGREFLGTRLLREYGRIERGADPAVHSRSGKSAA